MVPFHTRRLITLLFVLLTYAVSSDGQSLEPAFDQQPKLQMRNGEDLLVARRFEQLKDGIWTPTDSASWAFNAQGVETRFEQLRYMDGEWQSYNKITQTVDGVKVLLREGTSLKDGKWVSTFKAIYQYNDQDQKVEEEWFSWYKGQWVKSTLWRYTYDNRGNQKTYEYYTYKGTEWTKSRKVLKRYNEDNILIYNEEHEGKGSEWVPKRRYKRTLDSLNRQTLIVYEDWKDGQWQLAIQTISAYGEDGYQSKYLQQNWENQQWVNDFRYLLIWTGKNEYRSVHQKWQAGQWINRTQSLNKMDDHGNIYHNTQQQWKNDAWVNFRAYKKVFDARDNEIFKEGMYWNGTEWVVAGRRYLYYDFTSGTLAAEAPEGPLSISPNPACDRLYVDLGAGLAEGGTLSIYDLAGMKWLTKALQANMPVSPINISSLPRGQYVITLSTKTGQYQGRWVKQ